MMQYGHIYAAICIIIKLKVMFWKLYTRIYYNVGTFNADITINVLVISFRFIQIPMLCVYGHYINMFTLTVRG